MARNLCNPYLAMLLLRSNSQITSRKQSPKTTTRKHRKSKINHKIWAITSLEIKFLTILIKISSMGSKNQ